MASLAAMSLQRPRKVVTYGKSKNKSSIREDFFERDDGQDRHASSVKETYVVQKPLTARQAVKPTRVSKRETDLWDVPSSEDEREMPPLKLRTPLRESARPALVDDSVAEPVLLAPWERKVDTVAKAGGAFMKAARVTAEPLSCGSGSLVKTIPSIVDVGNGMPSLAKDTSTVTTLARRNKSNGSSSISKRESGEGDNGATTPRKRARKSPEMDQRRVPLATAGSDLRVYDFPADEETRPLASQVPSRASKPASVHPRRGQLTATKRTTPKKGLSAPARFSAMLPLDGDEMELSTHVHDDTQCRPATPHGKTPSKQALRRSLSRASTPPPATLDLARDSATADVGTPAAMTPKQVQLWSQLLPGEAVVRSPSSLATKELTMSSLRRTAGRESVPSHTVTKSQSDISQVHRRHTRLVDRLKASALSSEDESEDESSEIAMVEEASLPEPRADDAYESLSVTASTTPAPQQTRLVSQPDVGPKVTYARTRSYLPEDNLEDGLLLDLPFATPQRPALPTVANDAPAKPAFNLSDSEDDGAGGGKARLRTVHELRAAGRNNRFMQDTSAILEDISNRSMSARSSRRSALVDIATRLLDKNYADRFIAQGFESSLIAECKGPADAVSDSVLASALILLLHAGLPKHSLTNTKDRNVLDWLAGLLSTTTEIGKIAKDRKSNMSKMAQSSLDTLFQKLQGHESLSDDLRLVPISPRTIALKSLDMLVSKLRALGDRSELLNDEQLSQCFTSNTNSNAELGPVVSLLEALSTAALALVWPQRILEHLATLLPTLLTSSDIPVHTLFLALRLTLNLTNDNQRNSDFFASVPLIHALLDSITARLTSITCPTSAVTETEEARKIDYDLLVLALGICINIFATSSAARSHTLSAAALPTILQLFIAGQERAEEAESLDDSTTNVALGYLAVMLANACQDETVRVHLRLELPGGSLNVLAQAVGEFVSYHRKVDTLSFGDAQGKEVWGAFTEKLRGVLNRLEGVANT